MIVTLIKERQIKTWYLPQEIKGQFWITDKNAKGQPRKLLSIEAMAVDTASKWLIRGTNGIHISDITSEKGTPPVKAVEMNHASHYKITCDETKIPALLYCTNADKHALSFWKYVVPDNINISIGRGETNTIIYNNSFVGSSHCTLQYTNGVWAVYDNNSANGTFVNDEMIKTQNLYPGDVVYILGLKIIIGSNFIALNNPSNAVRLNHETLIPYKPETAPALIPNTDGTKYNDTDELTYFYRTPRFKRELVKAEFTIDAPPQNQIGDEVPMAMILGPSITMGIASLGTGAFMVTNALSAGNMRLAIPALIMSISMLLGTIMWPVLTRRHERKKKRKKEAARQKKYMQYLNDIDKLVQIECKKQENILKDIFIPVSACVNIITQQDINLWERNASQNDFLTLRLGNGEADMLAEFKAPEKRFSLEDDNLAEAVYQLNNKPKKLLNVPITLSFYKNPFTAIISEDRHICLAFANGLITQLLAYYGYDDVKTVFVCDEAEEKEFAYAKWLPHVWNNDESFRMIATNQDQLKQVSSYLEKIVDTRKELNNDSAAAATPYYVIFMFSRDLALRTDALRQIYESKSNLNISVISFFDELRNVPKECTAVIELDGINGKIFDKNDTSGKFTNFVNDIAYTGDMHKLSTTLANVKLDIEKAGYRLPKMITFLQMLDTTRVEHLNAHMRWKLSDPSKSLQAAVGVNTLGDLSYIDAHENFHESHGVIAGTTGSGKSEFIMTYILSLALNYHPNEVSFALIDYKGGSTANAFKNLPHTAGIITNLDSPASLKRSLLTIGSEMERRQVFLEETSAQIGESKMDIYKYQKAYRNGEVTEPLPHLFVIVDEFAELRTQEPEFITVMDRAFRIGRSIGVHLVLATQKPSGQITDQMKSNIGFKLCLKVKDRQDSMDMLDRPDASELVDTGRYYLQAGNGEVFVLGQSAWAGADYSPDAEESKQEDLSISVIDLNGQVIQSARLNKSIVSISRAKTQLDVITDYLNKTGLEENAFVRKLWLPPLENIILLQDLRARYLQHSQNSFTLNPLLGEINDMVRQRRLPLNCPISEKGNVLIYGTAGSGKATFISTMLYALISAHSAETLNIYLLDYGAETLQSFSKAPQVGDVVLADDSEKLTNLLKMLQKEIADRKKIFADWNGDYNYYCERSGSIIPNILVVINNYSSFLELYPDEENLIISLTQDCAKYGVYFVLTVNSISGIRSRVTQNFGQNFALQLNDEMDYYAVIGKTDGLHPEMSIGRGLVRLDAVYEFQIAHICEPARTYEEIRLLCNSLVNKPQTHYAPRIPILPDAVNIEFLSDIAITSKRLPIGVNKNSLNIECLQLASSYITLIAANDIDTSIPFVQGIAELLSANAGSDTMVLDADGAFVQNESAKYRHISSSLEDTIADLFELVVERHESYIKDNATDFTHLSLVIPSLSSLFRQLDGNHTDKLNLMFENGKSTLGVNIITADTPTGISAYDTRAWYKLHCNGDGIWVGDGVVNQYQLNITRRTNDLYDEIGSLFGLLIEKGRYKTIKLLQSDIVTNSYEGDSYA